MIQRLIVCALLLVPFYFPMFGKIIPGFEAIFRFNYAKYSMLLFVLSCAYAVVRSKTIRPLSGTVLALFVLNAYVVADLVIKGWWDSGGAGFQGAINLSVGFIFSCFTIIYLSQLPEFGKTPRLFEDLGVAIGLMASLQVLVSAYESRTGLLLGRYEVDLVATELSSRDVLQIIGRDQQRLFGFSFPFTGMIGQHNGFGIMLVFYNALFLLCYEYSRRLIFFAFLPIVLFGLIGNGTRSAIVLTAILNLIYFYLLQPKVWLKVVSGLVALLVLIATGQQLVEKALDFYFQANSLQSRIDLWSFLIEQYFPPQSTMAFLFGLNYEEINFIGADISGRGTSISVENEFLRIYLYTGFIGVAGFTSIFLGLLFMRNNLQSRFEGGGLRLIVISVFIMGMFMTGVTYYASYMLITIALLMVWHHKIMSMATRPPAESLRRRGWPNTDRRVNSTLQT